LGQRRFNPGNKAAEKAQEIRACVVNYYEILIPRINEAMDTDLKVIERLQQLG
jgi:hypothetical protein